ncbi:MAG: hypothetical protein CL623_11365 [Arcobacter sp.]|nr:hypothetical protein [Arcobacter sp.]|tara:strand:+ start:5323 stop:5562 length:240 start_codon:yes stop_codon:yes gene_type:complete
MYKIIVSNQCACFKKSNLENNLKFQSKDEALLKAIEMKHTMNNDFCKKHEFDLQEMYNNFVISFYSDARDNCCGNGCCS